MVEVGLAAILMLVFMILVKFSATESTFRCEGELTSRGQSTAATLYMTVTHYRWWVGLWGPSQGMVFIEAPKHGLPHEPYLGLEEVGNSALHIYINSEDTGGVKGLKGAYYQLSRFLSLDTLRGFFEGECSPFADK